MKKARKPSNKGREYYPIPKEIEEKCLEIKKEWSEKEYFKRAGLHDPDKYNVPVINIDSINLE